MIRPFWNTQFGKPPSCSSEFSHHCKKSLNLLESFHFKEAWPKKYVMAYRSSWAASLFLSIRAMVTRLDHRRERPSNLINWTKSEVLRNIFPCCSTQLLQVRDEETYSNVHQSFLHDMVRWGFCGEAEDVTRLCVSRFRNILHLCQGKVFFNRWYGRTGCDGIYLNILDQRNFERLWNDVVSWNSDERM